MTSILFLACPCLYYFYSPPSPGKWTTIDICGGVTCLLIIPLFFFGSFLMIMVFIYRWRKWSGEGTKVKEIVDNYCSTVRGRSSSNSYHCCIDLIAFALIPEKLQTFYKCTSHWTEVQILAGLAFLLTQAYGARISFREYSCLEKYFSFQVLVLWTCQWSFCCSGFQEEDFEFIVTYGLWLSVQLRKALGFFDPYLIPLGIGELQTRETFSDPWGHEALECSVFS